MNYPVVYVYKREQSSEELRHSLRSLSNITNFNGEVFVVGTKESWFRNIIHVPFNKVITNRYIDAEYKLLSFMTSPVAPKDFILMNDDFYITDPTEIGCYHQGEIVAKPIGLHNKQKLNTMLWLQSYNEDILDYDIHTPMLFNTFFRKHISQIVIENNYTLKPRSLYGNLWGGGGQYYKDQKTRTDKLPKASLISTHKFSQELKLLFPERSIYEK